MAPEAETTAMIYDRVTRQLKYRPKSTSTQNDRKSGIDTREAPTSIVHKQDLIVAYSCLMIVDNETNEISGRLNGHSGIEGFNTKFILTRQTEGNSHARFDITIYWATGRMVPIPPQKLSDVFSYLEPIIPGCISNKKPELLTTVQSFEFNHLTLEGPLTCTRRGPENEEQATEFRKIWSLPADANLGKFRIITAKLSGENITTNNFFTSDHYGLLTSDQRKMQARFKTKHTATFLVRAGDFFAQYLNEINDEMRKLRAGQDLWEDHA